MTYNYTMGIKVGGVNLPDPSSWEYEVSDLDTEGGRDATGKLHRAFVAQKVNYSFEWNGLEWSTLQTILAAVNHDKFTLIAPDPKTYDTTRTGTYYVGDRTGTNHYFSSSRTEKALFSLKMKFIEY